MVAQLSSKFQLFGKGNACPVCQSDDDRCKTPRDSELILCMTHRSSGNGFRFVGESKDGQWGKFYPGDSNKTEFTPEQRKAWREQKELERQKIEQERITNCLDATERDRLYTKLLSQFALHPDDKTDLLNRGISEDAIKQAGFVSVGKYQKLNQKYPTNLPGIGQDGRSLVIASEGYLCPVRDANGLIVALQIRVRNAAPNTGKYRWVSSESRHRLKSGEMPLAHYGSANNDKKWVALVEGTGAKPLICSQRLNCLTLGAAGGQFFNAESQIKDAIALGLQPILIPDAGAKKWSDEHQRWNCDVLRRYERLKAIAPNLKVFWWGQIAKSIGDVDEISDELLANATVINFEEYLAMHSDVNVKLANVNPADIEAILEAYKDQPDEPLFEEEPLPADPGSTYEKEETTIYQKVIRDLYAKRHWICIEGVLHQWKRNHYKPVHDEVHRKKISRYLNNYKVYKVNKDGETSVSMPFASSNYVGRSLSWVKDFYAVPASKVNPPGVNCVNGVLRIEWVKGKPKPKFAAHNPETDFYLYEPNAVWSEDADLTECDRMMQCLSPKDKDIFFKIIGASLDLENVLKYAPSRSIRAFLCIGEGGNGKDILRGAVEMIYGKKQMTSCTFQDFKKYDSGCKFPLKRLEFSRVNWSPENTDDIQLDDLQSLKAAITGDSISFEGKGANEVEGVPRAVYFFNMNRPPAIKGAIDAIKSRYYGLRFNKTFKANPDPKKGELKADQRFKHDPDFLKKEVLSGFLKYMVSGLTQLIDEGIKYDDDVIEEIKHETSHLLRFADEVYLEYCQGESVSVSDVWAKLEDWYEQHGFLEREGTKVTFNGNGRKDPTVNAKNKLFERLSEIFPKIKRGRDSNGVRIMNLRFYDPIIRAREIEAQKQQQIDLTESQQNTKSLDSVDPSTLPTPIYTSLDNTGVSANVDTVDTVDIHYIPCTQSEVSTQNEPQNDQGAIAVADEKPESKPEFVQVDEADLTDEQRKAWEFATTNGGAAWSFEKPMFFTGDESMTQWGKVHPTLGKYLIDWIAYGDGQVIGFKK